MKRGGDLYRILFKSEVSFWKRLKIAIRYLFNRKCKFGAFDEVIVNKERLKDLLNKL